MRAVILLVCLMPSFASAYEEVTHELLSSEALKQSVLADPAQNILINLGLKNELFRTHIQKFTNNDPNHDNVELSINNLIRFGAELEDDLPTERSLHHFYDPAKTRPLDMPGLSLFRDPKTSPDWAVEDVADIPEQDYSYKDATNYFFLALTSQTDQERNTNWGLMFQSLGHVIHHIQDMSQPDHVRNDAHCNLGVWDCVFRHDPSFYEEYTGQNIASTIPTYITLDYPIPAFPTAREFWTAPDDRGIADFTNLNFFSKDTNFQYNNGAISPSAEYPDGPIPNLTPIQRNISDTDLLGATRGQALCDELKTAYTLSNPAVGDCYIDFIQTTVTDVLNPGLSSNNQKAASLSIFDDELATYNSTILFEEDDGDIVSIDRRPSLNEFNFKAAHQYLIPRAVAYSAGLINHFFKAKFEVIVNDTNDRFIIRNLSGYTMSGDFSLYTTNNNNDRQYVAQLYVGTLPNDAVAEVPLPDLQGYGTAFNIVFQGQLDPANNTEEYIYSYDLEPHPVYSIAVATDVYGSGYFRQMTFMYNYETNSFSSQYKDINGVDTISRYFWLSNIPDSTCVFEFIGSIPADEAFPSSGDFSNAFHVQNGPMNQVAYIPSTVPVIGAASVPNSTDCTAASYGYRSEQWSNGYISKFHNPAPVSSYLYYVSSSSVGMSIDNYWGLESEGACNEAFLSSVNPAWPSTKSLSLSGSSLEEKEAVAAYIRLNVPTLLTQQCLAL